MKYIIKNKFGETCFYMDYLIDLPVDWTEKAAWVLASQHNFDGPYAEIWRYFRRLQAEARESALYKAQVTLK